MATVFTPEEKAKIRAHLGYHSIDPVYSIALGTPASTQPMFLVEGAMDRVPAAAAQRIRDIVCQLEVIECRLKEVPGTLEVSEVGNIRMRDDLGDRLEAEYLRWALRLSEALAAPINPYAQRFNGGKASLNVRVHG
jgi:hypothetical protein